MSEDNGEKVVDKPPAETTALAPTQPVPLTRAQSVANSIPFGMFGLQPTTFQEALIIARNFAESTCIPQKFWGKPNDVLVMMEYAANLRVPVVQMMRFFYMVNGTPSIMGQFMLAVIMGHPAYEFHDKRLEGQGDERVGVFKIKRRGHDLATYRFSVADAKLAELWGSAKENWKKFPNDMLQWRAVGRGCQDKFPDALCGLALKEEAEDYGEERLGAARAPAVIDADADLRNEIRRLYKDDIKTDTEGKRWNDARIAVLLSECRSRADLEGLLTRGKDELLRRGVETLKPVQTASTPANFAREIEQTRDVIHEVMDSGPVIAQPPAAKTQPVVSSKPAAAAQCPQCAKVVGGGRCHDCIEKDRASRINQFKNLLEDCRTVMGYEPQGPPTIVKFEGLSRKSQEEEIAKIQKFLYAASKHGPETLFEDGK